MGSRLRVTARLHVTLAIGIAAALGMCGCSSPAAPNLFPAVLADPPPSSDTTLSPDEVRQATQNLIAERDRLCLEAMASEGVANPVASCGAQNAAATAPAGGAAVKP